MLTNDPQPHRTPQWTANQCHLLTDRLCRPNSLSTTRKSRQWPTRSCWKSRKASGWKRRNATTDPGRIWTVRLLIVSDSIEFNLNSYHLFFQVWECSGGSWARWKRIRPSRRRLWSNRKTITTTSTKCATICNRLSSCSKLNWRTGGRSTKKTPNCRAKSADWRRNSATSHPLRPSLLRQRGDLLRQTKWPTRPCWKSPRPEWPSRSQSKRIPVTRTTLMKKRISESWTPSKKSWTRWEDRRNWPGSRPKSLKCATKRRPTN